MSAAAAFGGGIAAAQSTDFKGRDFDRNGMLDRQEFDLLSRDLGLFDARDTNRDQRIDADELQGLAVPGADLAAWDINGNGSLEESEYVTGLFTALDADQDSYLSPAEWRAAGEALGFTP